MVRATPYIENTTSLTNVAVAEDVCIFTFFNTRCCRMKLNINTTEILKLNHFKSTNIDNSNMLTSPNCRNQMNRYLSETNDCLRCVSS